MPENYPEIQYCLSRNKPPHAPRNSKHERGVGALRWVKAETETNTNSSENKTVTVARVRIEAAKAYLLRVSSAPNPRLKQRDYKFELDSEIFFK